MSSWLSEREQRLVAGAETASVATPIPTQIVSDQLLLMSDALSLIVDMFLS